MRRRRHAPVCHTQLDRLLRSCIVNTSTRSQIPRPEPVTNTGYNCPQCAHFDRFLASIESVLGRNSRFPGCAGHVPSPPRPPVDTLHGQNQPRTRLARARWDIIPEIPAPLRRGAHDRFLLQVEQESVPPGMRLESPGRPPGFPFVALCLRAPPASGQPWVLRQHSGRPGGRFTPGHEATKNCRGLRTTPPWEGPRDTPHQLCEDIRWATTSTHIRKR